jgi:hypothetical protein
MGGWNEHYKFNQYKVKLNEVFDNLDEIIYISSTIDYKKVNILLYKIVQNFDYYNYYIPPPEEEEAEPQETAPETPPQEIPQETPEVPPNETPTEQEPSPPPKEQPYSSIDTEEMIDIIMKDQEYQDLIAYIDGVQTNIRRKSGNLIEIINPLTEYLNDKTIENRLILQDYLKQHEAIKTKLKTIQENIREINYGIRQKYKIPPRKIKFDVILIPNTIEWEFFKYFLTNSSARYHFNRYFYTKQIHVLDGDISKENMGEFENKLKKLYNDLFIKFNEYIRENKNNKPITDKLKGSLSEDAEDPVDDADNPGAMEDYPDTQPIQTLLDMLEEKRGSVSKLFVKPQQPYPQQQRRPQQPYNPQQPQQPYPQQPYPQQPYPQQQPQQQRPQPPPYIQQPPQPKEPILDKLTEEITEKIKNKKDNTTQNLIEGTKNAKEGVTNFLTGLSTKSNLGDTSSILDGFKNKIPGIADAKGKFSDLAKGKLGDTSSILDGFKNKIPDIADAKGKFSDLAKGKLGDTSSILDGFKKNIPGIADAKGKFSDLAKDKLGDASSIMDGLKNKIPGAANAKSKFTDLANGNLGNASSILDGFKNNIPDAANAKSKFTDLAKDKFKGLIP